MHTSACTPSAKQPKHRRHTTPTTQAEISFQILLCSADLHVPYPRGGGDFALFRYFLAGHIELLNNRRKTRMTRDDTGFFFSGDQIGTSKTKSQW